jgi:hypothetical protein
MRCMWITGCSYREHAGERLMEIPAPFRLGEVTVSDA